MSTRNTVIRNTLFSSVGIYTEYFLGMLTSIIIARHLGPAHFGAYSLVVWLVATGVAITNSGVASTVIKFVAELRGSGREASIRPLLAWARKVQAGFLAVVLLAGTGLFLFQGDRIMPDFNHGILLAILLSTTVLRSLYMLNIGIAKGYENFRATALVAAVASPINLVLILLAWWLDGSMEWFLGVYTISSLVFWWVSRRQVAKLLPPRQPRQPLDEDMRRRLRSYAALVAVTVAVTFVTASEVEVLFLSMFDSAAAAGQFKVAFQLASGAALLVPGVFGALLLPMMANALTQGREVASRRLVMSTSYLAALAAPLVAFGVVFAKPIIALLYGAEYAPAAMAFALCLAALSFSTLSQGASSYLLGADRQRALLVIVLVCAVVKVALDVVLIRAHGLSGAVAAFTATSTLSALAIIVLALRSSGATLQWRRLARIAMAALVAAAGAWMIDGHFPPLPTLLLGGVALSVLYGIATLALGCWSMSDIDLFRTLHERFGRGRLRVLGRVLDWAARRAEAAA